MPANLVVRYDGDTAGADAASAKTRGQLGQTATAAEQMSKRIEAANRKAASSGKSVGAGLLKSITEATGSSILKGAGGAIGSGIANAAGRAIQQTNIYKGLQAKAGAAGAQIGKSVGAKLGVGLDGGAAKAGTSAGKKVADGVERQGSKINWSRLRTPALIGTAVGLGLLFGTRFGRSAGTSAGSAFKPNFAVPRAALGGLFRGLGAVAASAGLAAGAVLGAAVAKGGQRLDAIDSARGKLAGLGNDAKRVDAIMRDALASVKGTAFGLDEAATVSATAVAAGIKPGKELQRTLKLVADTATIGNTSLSESGSIFNKVATSNKVYNDTLNQLGDRGIPIVQLLAKQMGKSSDEVTKLASKGKIDFKTFQEALEGGLGGAALKSGDTFQGALKNAKAALGRFGANLLKGVFPQLKGVFGDVTKGLDGLGPAAERIGQKAGKVFGDLVGLGKSLGPVFKGIGAALGGAFSGLTKGAGGGKGAIKGLTDFVSTHQAELVGFFVSAGSGAIGFGKVVATVVSGALRGYAGLARGIQAALDGILGATQSALGAAAGAASSLGLDKQAAGLNSAADAVQKLRENNKADGAGAGIAEKIADGIDNKLQPALTRAQDGLEKMGKEQVGKAAQRDQAAKTAQAIDAIGTKANGSQIHLKKFSDISNLSSRTQSQLRSRIKSAAGALQDQIGAQQAAGAGQKALTKTWESGRDKLAGEFRQMGLSRKEAGRLADKYAGIKPKVKTNFTAPGLSDAKAKAERLKAALDNLPRDVRISVKAILSGADVAVDAAKKAFGYSGGVWGGPGRGVIKAATGGVWAAGASSLSGSRVVKAASGRVLPGWSPGRDIHRFYSSTAGRLDLSGGEAIMVPQFTRAVGGPRGVADLNRRARLGDLGQAMAGGGVPAMPVGPAVTAPIRRSSARAADAGLLADLRDAMYALAERPTQVDVFPDHGAIRELVRAEVRDALRKKAA